MKYLKTYKIFESKDRVRDHLNIVRNIFKNGVKSIHRARVNIGDKITDEGLPDSQVTPPKGIYTLKYIPIDKTDIVIKGWDTRKEFDHDDYDGYQTETFNYMKEHFDELPPIIFIEKEDGTYEHVDGHHRIIIAKELGRKEILAYIKELDQNYDNVIDISDTKYKTNK